MSFKVKIKNGTTEYNMRGTGDYYNSKVVDYVSDYEDLAEALATFLNEVADDSEAKVTLTYIPEGSKKK